MVNNDSKINKCNDSNQSRIVPRELNFDFGQFFYPQEKRKIFDIRYLHSKIVDKNGNGQEIRVIVSPAGRWGTLTTFDERVFFSLVEIWQEQDKPDLVYFSSREISRRLNVTWGKDSKRAIDESLKRLRGVFIDWEGCFYDKNTESYVTISKPFTILNHLEIISNKDRNFRSQVAEFGFDKHVITNLNLNYSRPIRFDVILSFKAPLAQALYVHLDRKLYGTKEYSRTTEGLLLNDLGLIGNVYSQKKARVQRIKKVQDELRGKFLGYGEVIEEIRVDTNRKGDALFIVRRSGSGKIKGYKTVALEDKNESNQTEIVYPTSSLASAVTEDTTELLEYFNATFSVEHNYQNKSLKVIKKTETIISKHGLKKAKHLIDYAKKEAFKTSYKPNTFNGIIKYLPQALKEYEQIQQAVQDEQQREEVRKKEELEKKSEVYKQANRDKYYQHINELMESLSRLNIDEYKQFIVFEEKELLVFLANISENFQDMARRGFYRDTERVPRFVAYFKDHPTIKIPDFWEWDTEQKKLQTSKQVQP